MWYRGFEWGNPNWEHWLCPGCASQFELPSLRLDEVELTRGDEVRRWLRRRLASAGWSRRWATSPFLRGQVELLRCCGCGREVVAAHRVAWYPPSFFGHCPKARYAQDGHWVRKLYLREPD